MSKIHYADIDELARIILTTPEEADDDDVEQALYDKWGVSFEQFHKIVEALAPHTIPASVALSGNAFKGFVHDGAFIVKIPA